MAQAGIWNRLCVYAMEEARMLLAKNMVATDTNGRNNQISAERGETDEQGFLWCGISTFRSWMLSAVGEHVSDTLWLQDKPGAQNECITGAVTSWIGGASAATTHILQEVQGLCNVDLAGLSVGEVWHVQRDGVVQWETGQVLLRKGPVTNANVCSRRIQQGRSCQTQQSLTPSAGSVPFMCDGSIR